MTKLSGVVDVGDCIMVGKDEAISMLATALQVEEIQVTPRLQMFLDKLRRSGMDKRVKAEIEKGLTHMLNETVEHSKTLAELLRKVAGGNQREY